jgi:uncharacterized membrane protein YqaE (UPF0057 family)
MGAIRAIFCILLPPIAVIDKGVPTFLIVCILTILGWIPGIIGAIIFCSGISFLRALFCVALPPLAVYDCGLGAILVTLVLTLLGWIPGIIGATLFVIMKKTNEKAQVQS